MSEYHIDIPCTKINAWLCNRGKIKKSWQAELRQIRKSIRQHRHTLHPDLLARFEGREIEYFDVLEIINELETQQKKSGKAIKSFFGGYTSDQIIHWDNIRQSYVADNMWIAECGRGLGQRCKYEIPRLKKQLVEYGKQISDLSRKIHDRKLDAKEWRSKFHAKCAEVGILGENVRSEVKGLTTQLPEELEKFAKLVRSDAIREASDLYQDYVTFLNSFEDNSKDDCKHATDSTNDENVGKDTKHSKDLKTGKGIKATKSIVCSLPGLLAVRAAEAYDPKSNLEHVENGWALVNASPVAVNATVSRPESSEEDPRVGASIDWGIEVEEEGGGSHRRGQGEAGDQSEVHKIAWDFEIEDGDGGESKGERGSVEGEGGAAAATIEWEISVLGEETSDPKVQGPDAKERKESGPDSLPQSKPPHLLERNRLRAQVMDDLLELKSFLRQRAKELDDGDPIAATKYSRLPSLSLAKRCNAVAIKKQLDDVQQALDAMCAPTIQRMLQIRASDRYLDRLTQSILSINRNASTTLKSVNNLLHRQVNIRNQVSQTTKTLDRAVKSCKQIQNQLETSLSAMFPEAKGLQIIGEVNKL